MHNSENPRNNIIKLFLKPNNRYYLYYLTEYFDIFLNYKKISY